jgi:transcriptional regulator with XRE-family HTH domain
MNFQPVLYLIKRLPRKIRYEWMSHTINASLAAQIRENRKARGWTQKEFAEKLGMAQPYVSRLETAYGAGHASISTLCRVAAVFDVALQIRFCTWGEWINIYITPHGAFTDEGICVAALRVTPFAEDVEFLTRAEQELEVAK